MGARQPGIRPTQYSMVGGPLLDVTFPVAASQNFNLLSGCFVVVDTNNRIEIAGAAVTNLIGWALTGDFTSSATAGLTEMSVNIALGSLYEMPIDAAKTEAQLKAIVGETCDIIVTSNIQYADLDASSIDILEIMDYRYYGSALGEQTVIVRLYLPNITCKGGVA